MMINKKKAIALNSALISFIFASLPGAYAGGSASKAESKAKAEKSVEQKTADKRQETMLEATAAIRETENALTELDQGKNKEALTSLEHATGKLEIILARDPKLALAPSGVTVVTHALEADIETVKSMRKQAQDLLSDGKVQSARRLLANLASETVVRTSNIPLATYPAAIKQAATFVDQGKPEDAKHVLQVALNTLVITETVYPLPVVASEQMLGEAEVLTSKKDRTAAENQRLDELLKGSRMNLEYAEALGYGTKKDFSKIYTQLSEIEKRSEKGKSELGLFDKIKLSLTELVKPQTTAAR